MTGYLIDSPCMPLSSASQSEIHLKLMLVLLLCFSCCCCCCWRHRSDPRGNHHRHHDEGGQLMHHQRQWHCLVRLRSQDQDLDHCLKSDSRCPQSDEHPPRLPCRAFPIACQCPTDRAATVSSGKERERERNIHKKGQRQKEREKTSQSSAAVVGSSARLA